MPGTIRRILHPSYIIRRKALYSGILGPSRAWKVIAVVVFGQGMLRKMFGKQADHLGIERLEAGQTVCITSLPPSDRGRRRAQRRRAAAVQS